MILFTFSQKSPQNCPQNGDGQHPPPPHSVPYEASICGIFAGKWDHCVTLNFLFLNIWIWKFRRRFRTYVYYVDKYSIYAILSDKTSEKILKKNIAFFYAQIRSNIENIFPKEISRFSEQLHNVSTIYQHNIDNIWHSLKKFKSKYSKTKKNKVTQFYHFPWKYRYRIRSRSALWKSSENIEKSCILMKTWYFRTVLRRLLTESE